MNINLVLENKRKINKMAEQVKKAHKKAQSGVVFSDKMDKTIVISITKLKKHPLYGKIMRKTKRIKAHDEKNECNIGDTVRVIECRPISKEKCWCLDAIIERAK